MHFSLKNILIIISLSFFSLTKAQIYSPSAVGSATVYKISGKADSIFVFSSNNPDKSIIAHLPDSTDATFEWSYYQTGGEYNIIASETGKISVIDTITSNLGYRLVINGIDTFRCWVFVYDFNVVITSTINDTIPNGDINCRTISFIKAQITDNDLYYHNLVTNKQEEFKPKNNIVWSSNQKDASNPQPSYSLQVSVEEPYWLNTWYIITVTNDDTKQKRSDSAFYKSVRPHAEFEEPEYLTLDNRDYYPDQDSLYYKYFYNSATYLKKSAPALYLFTNKSENADEFTWIFGDDSIKVKNDKDSVPHEYKLPGTYYAYLVAKRNVDFLYDPCYDTFPRIESDTNKILVDQAQSIDSTQIPNVFTSKHKTNWRFKEDVSVSDVEIAIFNRFGNRVYHFKGNIRDWPGWDGSNNGKRKVNTGVYFFVVKKISALPDFETEKLPEELVLVKRGFIHYYNLDD